MSGLPAGTVTFLFTDIEGSTRLWETQREVMPAAYARHDAILREAAARHRGVVYKTIGDAVQIAFPSARKAVEAALEAQRILQAEPWPTLEPLRVRMALHAGTIDPLPEGDYRSPLLNRLGRLLNAGHGGQILLTNAVAEECRCELPDGATLRDLGPRRLKDLLVPEHMYQLAHPDLRGGFPPLRTLDIRPHNLPAQPTSLIGRTDDIATLRALLVRDGVRLVTLTGPGGTGKTRLGLQIAAELMDVFEDGVYFVDLAAVADPGQVPGAIAQVLQVREDPGTPIDTTLQDHLRPRHVVLVLDNLEQVIDAAPWVSALLATCPRLTVLVTSRIRLNVRGEHEYPVTPLALPDLRRLPQPDALVECDSVRLFVERARAVRPAFAVSGATAPAVAEICVRLDGLPLAIELAAARIRVLPPEAMLGRLSNRLALVAGGARDLPRRQQTLRDTIAWSYDLLGPDLQGLFRRLAVFSGGCSLEAAEALAADLPIDVLQGLEHLVDHSLLRQHELIGEPRYTMLETIRDYGLEQLAASGEMAGAQRCHALLFSDWSRHVASLQGRAQSREETRLWTDADNLRAALTWALAQGDRSSSHALAISLGNVCIRRGVVGEARSWLEQLLEAEQASPSPERTHLLILAAGAARIQGDFSPARAWLDQGLAMSRSLGERRLLFLALHGMASLRYDQGDTVGAIAMRREALALAQATGDTPREATTLASLGFALMAEGDIESGKASLERALGLFRTLGNTVDAAQCLVGLAGVLRKEGDLERAMSLLTEALDLLPRDEERHISDNALMNFGEVAREYGDLHGAIAAYRESLVSAARESQAWVIAYCLEGLAAVAAATAQALTAARLLGAAEAFRSATGVQLRAIDRPHYDALVSEVQSELEQPVFEHVWASGRALPLADAISEALLVDVPVVATPLSGAQ